MQRQFLSDVSDLPAIAIRYGQINRLRIDAIPTSLDGVIPLSDSCLGWRGHPRVSADVRVSVPLRLAYFSMISSPISFPFLSHCSDVVSINMSTSVFTLYAFAVALLLFAFYRPIINLLTPRGIKGFPTLPSPVPIFGDALVVGKGFRAHGGLGGCMKELIKQLGPNFQLRIFFNQFVSCFESYFGTAQAETVSSRSYLWLNDYSTAIAVSQDRSGTFDTIQLVSDYLRQIVPTGMITLHTDEVWKHHRRIMGPAMTSRYLSKSTGKMNDSVRDLVSLWTRKADLAHGKAFSASHDMENAAMVGDLFSLLIGRPNALSRQGYHL